MNDDEVKHWAVVREDRVVEVLRDNDGKLYSVVREHPAQRYHHGLTVDRQHGRGQDENFVKNRAAHLAMLLGLHYIEDLRWPCKALDNAGECHCPECASKKGAGIGIRHTRPARG